MLPAGLRCEPDTGVQSSPCENGTTETPADSETAVREGNGTKAGTGGDKQITGCSPNAVVTTLDVGGWVGVGPTNEARVGSVLLTAHEKATFGLQKRTGRHWRRGKPPPREPGWPG